MKPWYEHWQKEVQELPSLLKQICASYLQKGRETFEVLCECRCQHCISLTYWWGVQQIVKCKGLHHMYASWDDPPLQRFLAYFQRMIASHSSAYSLKYHSPKTEAQIQAAYQDILITFENALAKEAIKGLIGQGAVSSSEDVGISEVHGFKEEE